MFKKKLNSVTIFGKGDPTGGDEILVKENECSGGLVVVSWGFDYGSGFDFVRQCSEEELKKLYSFEQVYDAVKWLKTLPNEVKNV